MEKKNHSRNAGRGTDKDDLEPETNQGEVGRDWRKRKRMHVMKMRLILNGTWTSKDTKGGGGWGTTCPTEVR